MPILRRPDDDAPLSQGDILQGLRLYVTGRNLHLRILASVANLGFDDHGWLADQDLQWLVQTGEAELHSKRSALAEDKSKLAGLQASGHFKNPAEEERRQKAIAKKQEELDAFEREVGLFRTELANRPQTAG